MSPTFSSKDHVGTDIILAVLHFFNTYHLKTLFLKYRTVKSGDEKRSRLLEIIRKIDIDEDDDLDESELVQERLTKNSISDLSTRFVSYYFSNKVTINY